MSNMRRVNMWVDGAGYQNPSRVKRVRDDGSSGNGNWLYIGVVYQINKYVEDNGSQASY